LVRGSLSWAAGEVVAATLGTMVTLVSERRYFGFRRVGYGGRGLSDVLLLPPYLSAHNYKVQLEMSL
jgi:hypothetical protein